MTFASVLGVDNKVGAIDNKGYITDLNDISSPNTWGVYMSGTGGMAPFSWAIYVCLGRAQIAFTKEDGNRTAFRAYINGFWENWVIITSV